MKILLDCHVYNRKTITEIALNQVNKYRPSFTDLQITNDHSTEYDNEWLNQFTDNIFLYPKKESINVLMYRTFKNFLYTDYTHFYHFDNDAFHDPDYINQLIRLYEQGNGLPISLYRSSYVFSFSNASKNIGYVPQGTIQQGVCGGISLFLSREHIEKIVSKLPPSEEYWKEKNPAWDTLIQTLIGADKKFILSNFSYVEHFGTGGVNHKTKYSDTGLNLTSYLKSVTPDIWKKIEE